MIVASMLVSPMMGPILGFTFGTVVRDRDLFCGGLKAELVGVGLTLGVGVVLGFVLSPLCNFYDWPTNEMLSRGQAVNLLVGLAFAIPSGAGVALSVTGGGGNSLVGVAIAASLLPPVVNTGMCLAFCMVARSYPGAHDPVEFARIAGISFVLFLLNVAVIYGVAIAVFFGKQVKKVRKQLSFYR